MLPSHRRFQGSGPDRMQSSVEWEKIPDGHTKFLPILQDLVPYRDHCQKTKKFFWKMSSKQGFNPHISDPDRYIRICLNEYSPTEAPDQISCLCQVWFGL